MYRVIKQLNNNVAIVRNNSGDQAVVMGGGVAFQKKKGDLIQEDKIEKVFTLKNEESEKNFSTLLKDVPLDFITTSYEIIEYGSEKYQFPVQEYIYVTLTDHIYFVYQKLIKNEYEISRLPNIKEEYPIEYQIAEDALKIIEQRLAVNFPKEEISRIALHFINAKGTTVLHDKSNQLERKVTELVQMKLKTQGITRNEKNKNYFDRLMVHLNYFLKRIDDPPEKNNSFSLNFEDTLKKEYPVADQISSEIYELLSNKLGKELSSSEKVYFTIHIQRLLDE